MGNKSKNSYMKILIRHILEFHLFTVIVVTCLITACLTSLFLPWFMRPFEFESGYQLVMGTFARVVVIANDKKTAQKCAKNAFEEIDKVNNLMSAYNEDSEIALVNREAFQKEIPVSEFTYEVLQKSVEFSKLTDGAFDVTIDDATPAALKSGVGADTDWVFELQIDAATSYTHGDAQGTTITIAASAS